MFKKFTASTRKTETGLQVESLCPIHDTLSHPVDVVRGDIVIE